MDIYVAVVNDRHIEPIIRPFTDRVRAIAWAMRTFRDHVAHPDRISEGT